VRHEAGHPVAQNPVEKVREVMVTNQGKDRGGTGPVKFIAGLDLPGPPRRRR